jgi:hypothetical protein
MRYFLGNEYKILTIAGWIVTKEEQLTKVKFGTKENMQ